MGLNKVVENVNNRQWFYREIRSREVCEEQRDREYIKCQMEEKINIGKSKKKN